MKLLRTPKAKLAITNFNGTIVVVDPDKGVYIVEGGELVPLVPSTNISLIYLDEK